MIIGKLKTRSYDYDGEYRDDSELVAIDCTDMQTAIAIAMAEPDFDGFEPIRVLRVPSLSTQKNDHDGDAPVKETQQRKRFRFQFLRQLEKLINDGVPRTTTLHFPLSSFAENDPGEDEVAAVIMETLAAAHAFGHNIALKQQLYRQDDGVSVTISISFNS